MTVLLSDFMFSNAKRAHSIDADEWYSDHNDETSKRATTHCPHCGKAQMPFMHKNLKYLGYSHPWVGVDYQDTHDHYECKCSKCRKSFQFRMMYGG